MIYISDIFSDRNTLIIKTRLALLIGLQEAIVLGQVHYWLKYKENVGQDFINGRYWIYNTYEQWQKQFPFWSISTIRRIFSKLEKQGLLIAGNFNKVGYDHTKWYSIDYKKLDAINLPSVQSDHNACSNRANRSVQNEQTDIKEYNTKEYIHKINSRNGTIPKDIFILESRITKLCRELGIQEPNDYVQIIIYFFISYEKKFNSKHPKITNNALRNVINNIKSGTDNVDSTDFEMYKGLIDLYFTKNYAIECDYNICHFMTEGIRNNLFWDAHY